MVLSDRSVHRSRKVRHLLQPLAPPLCRLLSVCICLVRISSAESSDSFGTLNPECWQQENIPKINMQSKNSEEINNKELTLWGELGRLLELPSLGYQTREKPRDRAHSMR